LTRMEFEAQSRMTSRRAPAAAPEADLTE